MATRKRTTKKESTKKQPNTFNDCTSESCGPVPPAPPADKRELPPIIVRVPDEVLKKTNAICDLSSAIKSLAEALASPSCHVTIRDCTIKNTSSMPGISITNR